MVLRNISTWQLICWWYPFVIMGTIPEHPVSSVEEIETNCRPLSVSKYVDIQYKVTHWSSNNVAALVRDTVVTIVAPCQLLLSVCQDNYVVIAGFRLWCRTDTTPCQILKRSSRRKQTELLLMTRFRTLFRTRPTVLYCGVRIVGHLGLVMISLQCIIRSSLVRVTRKDTIVCQVLYASA